jgi:hypothetical protein
MGSFNKSLMLLSEKPEFIVGKSSRPITNGGGTLSKGSNKSKWFKPKERAVASTAMKTADQRRRAAYNSSRK